MNPESRDPDTTRLAPPASDARSARPDPDGPDAVRDPLLDGLRALHRDVPPSRDLWPDIAARLEVRDAKAAPVPASRPGPAGTAVRSRRRRRNATYAAAAALVLALAAGWQVLPLQDAGAPTGSTATGESPVSPTTPATPPLSATAAAADADAPLLRAADALAREYQGALREVQVNAALREGGPVAAPAQAAAVAELDRSAAEVRAALARDPDALHLFHRLQRIHAHRLALTLRQATPEESNA